MGSKKGDTMTVNVIIVAAIALIILVVLVAIFTGRINLFNIGVEKSGDTELAAMKLSYGQCRPTAAQETAFTTEITQATSDEAKEQVRTTFNTEVERCKSFSSDMGVCEANNCRWGK